MWSEPNQRQTTTPIILILNKVVKANVLKRHTDSDEGFWIFLISDFSTSLWLRLLCVTQFDYYTPCGMN